MKGSSQLVRYADDWVATFEFEGDARRVLAVAGKRLGSTSRTCATDLVDF